MISCRRDTQSAHPAAGRCALSERYSGRKESVAPQAGSGSVPAQTPHFPLKLMGVLAHPDDESLGIGGTLARYASEGVETYLVTATRGERGRFGETGEKPPPDVVGRVREAELRDAARVLGVREISFLDYHDGELDQVNVAEAVARIAGHIRRVQPHVVVTFGPEGAYGHPDHIAISQLTTAAVVTAAGENGEYRPHRVSKLYYIEWSQQKWDAYQTALRGLVSKVDGVERKSCPWPDWSLTTVMDTSQVWPTVWEAVSCHKTQMSIYKNLEHLSAENHKAIWGTQEFYRAFSLVNGGRAREFDLFVGLR
jgi:LmbE family N-acetylglucosaminyl deacetylase